MGALCSKSSAGVASGAKAETSEMMVVGKGVQMRRMQYLAGFKEACRASYPTCDMLAVTADATINGTIDDVAKAHPELMPALYNDVKACVCGKPCAFTLKVCNACGRSLVDTPVTKSENVFAAFLLGVAKASKGFPYKISLRHLSNDVLITDDLLALSPIHLNAIPKKHYIPDWRFLLTSPKRALELLDVMEAELWETTRKFLQDKRFLETIFKPGVTEQEIRDAVVVSFNFPPSQFQLHIQWIVPPLMPFQYFMAEQGNHFHEDRAFPMSYVRKVLALNEPYDVKKDTPIEDIVRHFDQRGVNYKEEWKKMYESALQSNMKLQNWNPDDFQYVVQDGTAYEFRVQQDGLVLSEKPCEVDAKNVQEKDKAALQNYGRPYSSDGKPSGTYISSPLLQTIGEGGFGEWPGVLKA